MAAASSGKLGLPRARRIKQARDFARVRAQGERVASGCLIVNCFMLTPGSASRLGVVTGRKIGSAVQRSRARRVLREAFRVHQREFVRPADLVLVARPSIVGKSFQRVEKDLLGALRQVGLLPRTA